MQQCFFEITRLCTLQSVILENCDCASLYHIRDILPHVLKHHGQAPKLARRIPMLLSAFADCVP